MTQSCICYTLRILNFLKVMLSTRYAVIIMTFLLTSCANKNIKPASYFAQHLIKDSSVKPNLINDKASEIVIKQINYTSLGKDPIINCVVKANILYTVDSVGHLTKFDLNKRNILWSKKLFKGKVWNNGIVIGNDNNLYIVYSRTIHQIDLDGNLINYRELSGAGVTDPILQGNKLYVATANGILYDLNKDNFSINHKINYSNSELFSGYPNAIAVINGENLVFSDIYNNIYFFNNRFEEFKSHKGSDPDPLKYTVYGGAVKPIISDNAIYLSHNTNGVKILDFKGNIIKERKINELHSWILKNDHLFIINKANQVAKVSAKDLKIEWLVNLEKFDQMKPVKPSQFSSYSNIIEYQGNLIFTDTFGYLYALDMFSGKIKFKTQISTDINQLFLKKDALIGVGKYKVIYWTLDTINTSNIK